LGKFFLFSHHVGTAACDLTKGVKWARLRPVKNMMKGFGFARLASGPEQLPPAEEDPV
jgi:hypothetical protein